jgi:glucokinase
MSTKEFVAVGVAAPGRIDRKHGIVVAFGRLPWKDVPLLGDVQQILSCPVVVENDAKLAGLSEAMLLKDTYNKVLYVTVSTGIGTGIIIDQRIDPAFVDSEGGDILLEYEGKLQKWEDFASGRAMVARYGKQAQDITDEETWRKISHAIAIGLIDLIAVIQPEVVVIGGGVGTHFEKFDYLLRDELKTFETPLVPIPPIMRAQRPEEAVVYGCYDLARSIYGHTSS